MSLLFLSKKLRFCGVTVVILARAPVVLRQKSL